MGVGVRVAGADVQADGEPVGPGQVFQHEPGVDEIEAALLEFVVHDVVTPNLELRKGERGQDRRVQVGGHDVAARTDTLAQRLEATLAAVRRPRDLTALPPNDLASSPLAADLLRLGAFRADVSGAGPIVYGLFHRRSGAEAARSVSRRPSVCNVTLPAVTPFTVGQLVYLLELATVATDLGSLDLPVAVADLPDHVRLVHTWTAPSNTAMHRTNTALGFRVVGMVVVADHLAFLVAQPAHQHLPRHDHRIGIGDVTAGDVEPFDVDLGIEAGEALDVVRRHAVDGGVGMRQTIALKVGQVELVVGGSDLEPQVGLHEHRHVVVL